MDNCSTKILVAAVVPVHTHWSPHDTILWKSVISFINSALLGCHKKSKDRKFFFQIKRRQRRNFLGVTKKEQRLEDSLKKKGSTSPQSGQSSSLIHSVQRFWCQLQSSSGDKYSIIILDGWFHMLKIIFFDDFDENMTFSVE